MHSYRIKEKRLHGYGWKQKECTRGGALFLFWGNGFKIYLKKFCQGGGKG
jgi:hypothetical protein